jgi:hypothetical protein
MHAMAISSFHVSILAKVLIWFAAVSMLVLGIMSLLNSRWLHLVREWRFGGYGLGGGGGFQGMKDWQNINQAADRGVEFEDGPV